MIKIDLTEEERKAVFRLCTSALIILKIEPDEPFYTNMKEDLKSIESVIHKLSEKK